MNREKIDKILEIYNNAQDAYALNEICSIAGISPLKDSEVEVATRDINVAKAVLQKIVSSIEEKVEKEDEDYFYDKLNMVLYPFIRNEERKYQKIDILLSDSSGYDSYSAEIISSLKDQTKQEQYLDRLSWDSAKAKIISNFKSDMMKLKHLETLKTDEAKANVIISLKDDKSKLEFLDSIDNQEECQRIMTSCCEETIDQCLLDNRYNDYLETMQKCKLVYDLKRGNKINIQGNKKYESFALPKDMTIGIEIEAEGNINKLVLEKLDKLGMYKIKDDASLQNGIEAVSPIMNDTVEYVDGIYETTKIMETLGFETNGRCGGHVHIGADYLKSVDEMKELLEIWGNAEEIFYLISNRTGELPRSGVYGHSGPISSKISESDLKESKEEDFIEDAKKVQERRESGINLMNLNKAKNTIEFRASNGTIDPDIWIKNVKLYGRTIQMAHELGQIKTKLEAGQMITDAEKKKLQMKAMLKKDITKDEKMEALMGLLFEEDEKSVYQERYVANSELAKQTERMDDLHFAKKVDLGTKEYGTDDYKEIYDNTEIPKDIIEELKEPDRNHEEQIYNNNADGR